MDFPLVTSKRGGIRYRHEFGCTFYDDGACDCGYAEFQARIAEAEAARAKAIAIQEDLLNDELDLMSPAEIRGLALEALRAQKNSEDW